MHEIVGDLPLPEGDKLNFAQAALVLQNSSYVYSRKVEYLYNLVYRALDELVTGHQRKLNSNSKSTDIDQFFAFDSNQDFLLLDDVLPTDEEGRNINLNEAQLHTSSNSNLSRRLSLTRRLSHSINSTSWNNSANETVARALIGSLDTGSLRLVDGCCDISSDGCLLLPGSKRSELEMHHATQSNVPLETNDDDDDGAGFAMADDDQEDINTSTQQPEHDQKKRVTFHNSTMPTKHKKDPWELLDPHVTDKKAKPLKIGKTIRLPPGVDEPPSACVNGSRTRRMNTKTIEPPKTKTTVASLATRTFHATLRKRTHNESIQMEEKPVVPLQGLAFGEEFAYIAKATAKRRAAERRERRQQTQLEQVKEPLYEEEEEDDYGGFGYTDDDDGDYQGGNTGMASLDDAYRPNGDNAGKSLFQNGPFHRDTTDLRYHCTDDSNADAQTFEELCRAHISAFAKGAERYASETQLSRRVGEWQSKLLPIIEEEERRGEFDIHIYGSTVISTIENEIQRKNPKDSHEKMIRTVDFATVTRHCPRYEVCRMFLASLSLFNSGNVELSSARSDGRNFELELIRTSIDRPMETYLAPSIADCP